VTLLIPIARVIAITPNRSADNTTIRARQTIFCGVFRSDTQRSSVARSPADSQIHASVLLISPDEHTPTAHGNRPLGSVH